MILNFCKPIKYFLLVVVDHHILRLDVSVHDAEGVTVMQSFQDLVQVVFALAGLYDLQKLFVVNGVHMLEHQAVGFALPLAYSKST